MNAWRFTRVSAVAAVSLAAAACSQQPRLAATSAIQPVSFTAQDRECMARAMYFESHRGADEGMVAVGTVVANRKDSGRWGSTVCEVVGQKRQFAPGVMTRTMDGEAAERARRNAEKVLSGQRHPALKTAMFFHTAGYKFRYPNMHYVLVAGGNAFYEKREVVTAEDARQNAKSKALALAYARIDPTGASKSIMVASNDASRPAPQPVVVATAPVVQPTVAPAAPQLAAVAPAPKAAPAPQLAAAPAAPKAVVAAIAPAKPVRAKPAETPLAFASADEQPAAAKALMPTKRVLQPSKLTPALASAAPVAAPKAEPAPEKAETVAAERSRSYAYNGEVAAAFAAFDMR
ncbi:cell wall hydrolase [Chenggangzhangella methanolivorans]|nr:cell wall hydrolase [Chenggangzhangella methanolivorans]